MGWQSGQIPGPDQPIPASSGLQVPGLHCLSWRSVEVTHSGTLLTKVCAAQLLHGPMLMGLGLPEKVYGSSHLVDHVDWVGVFEVQIL
jgi:hypothetical protein